MQCYICVSTCNVFLCFAISQGYATSTQMKFLLVTQDNDNDCIGCNDDMNSSSSSSTTSTSSSGDSPRSLVAIQQLLQSIGTAYMEYMMNPVNSMSLVPNAPIESSHFHRRIQSFMIQHNERNKLRHRMLTKP
jgi:hypothetical protein